MEALTVFIGIDALTDPLNTANNVLGDIVGTYCIGKIDAAVVVAGAPTSAVSALVATDTVKNTVKDAKIPEVKIHDIKKQNFKASLFYRIFRKS